MRLLSRSVRLLPQVASCIPSKTPCHERPGPHRPLSFFSETPASTIRRNSDIVGDSSNRKEKWGPCGSFLARASVRPVSRQRTWPQPKLRAQRRGHVVQMLAAVAAIFFRRIIGAQPMATSLAFGINTLHGPSWQIAHAASLAFKSTAPKSVDRILQRDNCGVKVKGTTYRGMFADLWKSVNER